SAASCYKCGADFPLEHATSEVAPKLSGDSGPAAVTGYEREPQQLHHLAADPVDTVQRRVYAEAPQVAAKETEFFARQRLFSKTSMPGVVAAQRTPQIIPVRVFHAKPRRYLVTRVALPTLLVVAIPIVGYFGYRHQTQTQNG